MKKNLLLFAVALFAFSGCSSDDEGGGINPNTPITTYFDPAFAAELEKRGYIEDADNITIADVCDITELNVNGEWNSIGTLTSLHGIEYFTALTKLYCNLNQLTSLDVSNNTALTELQCGVNQLTALDISKNTALTVLYCSLNQLTSLDVSYNTVLTELYCDNNQLTTLDASNNTVLTTLYCQKNQLTSLDISNNTALTTLHCANNQLTALDISKNTALTNLEYSYNPGTGSIFPITAWFDNDSLPPGWGFSIKNWNYNGQTITIDYRKAE